MQLIKNSKLAAYNCGWCGVLAGADVHSAACPLGERYKQVQQLGGVPWPREKPAKRPRVVAAAVTVPDDTTHCLECGKVVGDSVLACDECLNKATA